MAEGALKLSSLQHVQEACHTYSMQNIGSQAALEFRARLHHGVRVLQHRRLVGVRLAQPLHDHLQHAAQQALRSRKTCVNTTCLSRSASVQYVQLAAQQALHRSMTRFKNLHAWCLLQFALPMLFLAGSVITAVDQHMHACCTPWLA